MVALQFNYCDCLEKCGKDCLEKFVKLMEKLGRLQEVKKIKIVDEKKHPSVILSISSAGDPHKVKNLLKKYDKKFWKHRPPKKDDQQERQSARHTSAKQAVDKKQNVKKPRVGPCGHELRLKSYEKQFKCAGCKEKGIVLGYRCDSCRNDFHKQCASRNRTIFPEFFPNYTFKFRSSTTNQRSCYACGKNIRGYFYRCESKKLYLHPPCCNLNIKLYDLDFVHRDKMASSSKCSWCKESLRSRCGCAYVSTIDNCHVHVYCITQKVHEASMKSDINRKKGEKGVTVAINGNKGANGNGGIWKRVRVIWKRFGEFCRMLGEICKILLPFIGAVASILLGDPTGMFVPMLIAFFVNILPKLLSSKTKRNEILPKYSLSAQQWNWFRLLAELKDM